MVLLVARPFINVTCFFVCLGICRLTVVVVVLQVNRFLYTCLKLNAVIKRYSALAAVVLVSLPPPPPHQPSFCYMEYMDCLVAGIPRLLMVRGYRRDVVTIFTWPWKMYNRGCQFVKAPCGALLSRFLLLSCVQLLDSRGLAWILSVVWRVSTLESLAFEFLLPTKCSCCLL